MKSYACKCGYLSGFGSYGPTPCDACPKCGTNGYGEEPSEHRLGPWRWKISDEGQPFQQRECQSFGCSLKERRDPLIHTITRADARLALEIVATANQDFAPSHLALIERLRAIADSPEAL